MVDRGRHAWRYVPLPPPVSTPAHSAVAQAQPVRGPTTARARPQAQSRTQPPARVSARVSSVSKRPGRRGPLPPVCPRHHRVRTSPSNPGFFTPPCKPHLYPVFRRVPPRGRAPGGQFYPAVGFCRPFSCFRAPFAAPDGHATGGKTAPAGSHMCRVLD